MPKGSGVNSGFSSLSKAFKSEPTIENYVQLRRNNPNEEIEVAVSSGFEWVLANEELLKSFDISVDFAMGALDADPASISELSLQLMELLIERKELKKAGETHQVVRGNSIGDSLVNFLTSMMLDSLEWKNSIHIPRDLIVLIRHQIGGDVSKFERKMASHRGKQNAIIAAIWLVKNEKKPYFREIAKMVDVNVTTVTRWFPGGQLELEKEMNGIDPFLISPKQS